MNDNSHIHASSAQPHPSANVVRYIIESSDVIQDMRINVFDEARENVVWYKERFLGDTEIIEHVVHNHTSTICWTIHRPKRGWYIRIRSPTFPPDAALVFNTRTNATTLSISDESYFSRASTSSTASIHSYPPTPTSIVVTPPFPPSTTTPSDDEDTDDQPRSKRKPRTQITQLILSPQSSQPLQADYTSFFSRALAMLRNNRPIHSNSFTLSRMPVATPLSPPPPYALSLPGSLEAMNSTVALTASPTPTLHSPLLVFHDRTPVLTVRSLSGMIEIDQSEERLLGVETSFWIAIALTYLEFLEERESYLAALND